MARITIENMLKIETVKHSTVAVSRKGVTSRKIYFRFCKDDLHIPSTPKGNWDLDF